MGQIQGHVVMADLCNHRMVLPLKKSNASLSEKDWQMFCDVHRKLGRDQCRLSLLVTNGMKNEVVREEDEEGMTGQDVYL